jgi:hypothetical protein
LVQVPYLCAARFTPASILEKIIRYEAVHEIQDWDDLRRRIDPSDRRCYPLFHPALIADLRGAKAGTACGRSG